MLQKFHPASRDFFEEIYGKSEDPWNFESSSYELERYQTLLERLPRRVFRRAFEAGCSIGVLTSLLAGRCRELHATDVSQRAVDRARERCRSDSHVHVYRSTLPADLPGGTFDLIVLSEIGYYFDPAVLRRLLDNLLARLEHGGILAATHWTGTSADHLLSGNEVHRIIDESPGIRAVFTEEHPGFVHGQWTLLPPSPPVGS